MTDFREKDLHELKSLCRIALTPEEDEEVLKSLKRIIDYVDTLDELNVDEFEPTTHISNGMVKNVVRDDEEIRKMPKKELLSNAPDQIGGMIRIPAVFENSE